MLNRLEGVFASFRNHQVKYLVIGGIAALRRAQGYVRPRRSHRSVPWQRPKPARRPIESGLGAASLTSAEEVLANEVMVFQDQIRIDVQTRTPGLLVETAWEKRNEMEYRGQPFYVVSREDLISSKRAARHDIDFVRVS